MKNKNRVEKLRNEFISLELDGVLVSAPANIIYLTSYSNFALNERESFVLITKKKQFFFTNSLYFEEVRKQVEDFEIVEITREKPFVRKILKDLSQDLGLKKIGFEENNLTAAEYLKVKKVFKLIPFSFENLRIIKTADEIYKIEEACRIGDKAFEFLLTKIMKGITEKDLEFELEMFVKARGFEQSFKPIIAFGANASMPHYQTGDKKLEDNSIVLMDFGVKFENYCSDMTRTVFFGSSEKNAEFKKIYKAVLESQKKAIEYVNNSLEILRQRVPQAYGSETESLPKARRDDKKQAFQNDDKGVKASEIDKVAREYILSKGYPLIPHSLGHGIGLEVHEAPRLSPGLKQEELKIGMVFSIEPGIYIPGFGGVRIEDLFVLEKNGLRQLTKSDKNLIEL